MVAVFQDTASFGHRSPASNDCVLHHFAGLEDDLGLLSSEHTDSAFETIWCMEVPSKQNVVVLDEAVS